MTLLPFLVVPRTRRVLTRGVPLAISLLDGADFLRPNKRSRMFDTLLTNPSAVIGLLIVLAVIVVVAYAMFGGAGAGTACPSELHRRDDGSLELRPTGQTFRDMNAFQQWWHAPGGQAAAGCPLPLMTGAREVSVMEGDQSRFPGEQTYAKTPIYKVDDYEFSRVFGYERDGHMIVPRENYNMILTERTFDWADRPMTSDERRDKYMGLREGFTATGDLKSEKKPVAGAEGFAGSMDPAREAAARYGEKRGNVGDDDIDCKISREAREVADMVAKAYESDPNWEPVVTKVGANQWEVTELKPRRRYGEIDDTVEERVVDTSNDAVDVRFKFRERPVVEDAIDPYFGSFNGVGASLPSSSAGGVGSFPAGNTALTSSSAGSFGSLPFASDRYSNDPFMGPVPGMERMFGPTFDHIKWY